MNYFHLLSDNDIERHIEEWLATEGAGLFAVDELTRAVRSAWPNLSESDARFFADGMLCGVYLMRVRSV